MIRFLIVFFLVSFSIQWTSAQLKKSPGTIPVNDLHRVYTYQKSNWDDSHASQIYLYIADSNRLESFKWNKGEDWSTLILAEIDWEKLSVRRLENHRVSKEGKRTMIAWLEVRENRKLVFQVMDFRDSMVLDDDHWHSYDFDFASLGFTWRVLKNKESSFSFLIADAAFKDNNIGFENKGMVTIVFKGKELMNKKNLMKYYIDGPGLQHKGGYIWINPDTWMIESFKIQLPDEEGYINGKLTLLHTQKLEPEVWERFIKKKMIEK